MTALPSILASALERRAPLLASRDLDCYRLLDGAADNVPGFVLERLGTVLIAQVFEGQCQEKEPAMRAVAEAARCHLGLQAVYRKVFPVDRSDVDHTIARRNSDATPWLGSATADRVDAVENGIRFRIRPYDGFAVGLFLDQRANRKWLRGQADGKRVLNLFAYTCGFSVAAACGGAAETLSVDVSKKYLEWGRDNFAANNLTLDGHRFIVEDALHFLERIVRRGERFELVVLDPPTFGRSKARGTVFALRDDLDRLVHLGVGATEEGGHLLLAVNHHGTGRKQLETALQRAGASAGRSVMVVARPGLPLDFKGGNSAMKSVIARVD